jgi:hypothetical protein
VVRTERTADCVAGGYTIKGSITYTGDIVTTTDGGGSWESRPVPQGISDLYGLSCPTSFDCWTIGRSTDAAATTNAGGAATTNGGSTWRPETLPGDISILYAESWPNHDRVPGRGMDTERSGPRGHNERRPHLEAPYPAQDNLGPPGRLVPDECRLLGGWCLHVGLRCHPRHHQRRPRLED